MKTILVSLYAIILVSGGVSMADEMDSTRKATFAGGCFWCVEAAFDGVAGVKEAVSGYSGGDEVNPSYKQVAHGQTGHREAVQVEYDPGRISYEELLDIFWRQIDPTDEGGQFADRGQHYSSAIYFHDEEQEHLARASLDHWQNSGKFSKAIATTIAPYKNFYPAEDYHQNYYSKNSQHYKRYKAGSGRTGYIQRVWQKEPKLGLDQQTRAKPSSEKLKSSLTALQYQVTQENGTERAFANEFWDNHQAGIYVDVVSGEPLFSSQHKYDSGTGWPSFSQALPQAQIVEKTDSSHGMRRTEVRSGGADSHLGHLFEDLNSNTGQRYCINSASLRFIPWDELEQEGYPQLVPLFEDELKKAR